MRFVGIDVASETHFLSAVDEESAILLKPSPFAEDADGYHKLFEMLGEATDTLVVMEATGHYWKNLFAHLTAHGFPVVLINPLRSRRFAEEDLVRTKTDAIDALGLARFGAEKRPTPTALTDSATDELRELVRHRERLLQDFGDRTRQLHRLVDLGFPEFTRHVRTLDSELATTILHECPTARSFQSISLKRLAHMRYDGQHRVGEDLARTLLEAAKVSVGSHHGHAYQLQVRHTCEDLDLWRRRLREIDRDIEAKLAEHEVGTLLTTIDGIGPTTAARLIAELGNPARFESGRALAAYMGVVPRLRQSGKSHPSRGRLAPIGHARLRAALWMPTLVAVRRNPWLKHYYEQLRHRGKLPKVALVACMHKLLLAVHSVARRRQPFVPNLPTTGAP
jgi:transposase